VSASLNTVFIYDGSYSGFLTAVFESYARHCIPSQILSEDSPEIPFGNTVLITSDQEKADRVTDGLIRKAGADADALCRIAFLTFLEDREIKLLYFIRFCMKEGKAVPRMLSHPIVHPIERAVRHAREEAHLFTGFLRFSDIGGRLCAVIRPKNRVLYLFAEHFADRYPNEAFLIYDETHHEVLLSVNGRYTITPSEDINLPPPDSAEKDVRALWKKFFETLAIRERTNPVCQRTNLPLRYRTYMVEFLPEKEEGSQRLTEGRE